MSLATRFDPTEKIPPLPHHPRSWGRAYRSMRALLDEPEKTERAMDMFHAADRGGFERQFQRFLAEPEGRRLLARRTPVIDLLGDRVLLASLPEGSLGRVYLAYLEDNGFEADGLLQCERRVARRWEQEDGQPRLDPARQWFRDRFLVWHDLFHVLTGYGTDHLGEATLLAFTWAQVGGGVQAMLTLGAALEVELRYGSGWPSYWSRAWRRGRHARWLLSVPLEDLLDVPLEAVRHLSDIEPPEVAHPTGILRADFSR